MDFWIVIFSFVILIHWLSWILTRDEEEKEEWVHWLKGPFTRVRGGRKPVTYEGDIN